MLTQLLNLGWPAIVTVAFTLLAREYMRQVQEEIAWLRARITALETRTDKVERETFHISQ